MRHTFIIAVYALCGVVHLIPVTGVASRARLEALYGIPLEGAGVELELLLRHRAVLFAVVGVFLLGAAWRPDLRVWAGALGLVSMLSYVGPWWGLGVESGALGRVARVDILAGVALAIALAWQVRGG